jgi:hypothetical protein
LFKVVAGAVDKVVIAIRGDGVVEGIRAFHGIVVDWHSVEIRNLWRDDL